MGNMPPSEPGGAGAGSGPDWGEMKGKLQAAGHWASLFFG